MTLKVLCLDIEGGHGGSSRSLLAILRGMDFGVVRPAVLCRRGGWIEDAYAALGIPCRVEPDMPRSTSLERVSRNLADRVDFRLRRWRHARAFRDRLLRDLDGVDVLHLNHISLTDLAVWVRRQRPDLKMVMHLRTEPYLSSFSTRQARQAARVCDAFVFITENERNHFEAQGAITAPGAVIFNPVALPDHPSDDLGAGSADRPLRVACLSNYAFVRGIDRLIEIAEALTPEQRTRLTFVVAGTMHLTKPIPARWGSAAQGAKTLPDVVSARGLEACFEFLGHVSDPERVLAGCHVLIKPTRQNNPWGRDILEALGVGRPVLSVGTYSRFVESGLTGLLQARFDAAAAARFLIELADAPPARVEMGRRARARIASMNDPTRQAERLTALWRDVVAGAVPPQPARIRVAAVMPAWTAGGSERVLTTLAAGLPAEAIQTRLFVVGEQGDLSFDSGQIASVHTLGIPRIRSAVWPLWRLFRGLHTQVIVSSQAHLNIVLLWLGLCLPGVRVIVREANMPSACLDNGHWPRWYRLLYRLALQRAACVIASSEQMKTDLMKTLGVPSRKIVVLYNPVDADGLRARAAKPIRPPGPGRRFVAVGRLVRQKGFDRLIDWMAGIVPEDRLDILGDGPDRPKLEARIDALGVGDRVRLHGFIADPAPVIAGADALLMPSRWEGMPNAALEALALGTPVIATPESGAIAEVADQAPAGAVTLAEDFPKAMADVLRQPASAPRPSLLPPAFDKPCAIRRFTEIVSGRPETAPHSGLAPSV